MSLSWVTPRWPHSYLHCVAASHVCDTCHRANGTPAEEKTDRDLRASSLDAGIIKAFKAAYRRDLVSLLVERAEQGEEMTINLLQGLRMVHHAWQDVSAATVTNCWNHAGILQRPPPCDPLDDENCSLAHLRTLMQRLGSVAVDVPAAMEYVGVDQHEEACAPMTDEDIVRSVTAFDAHVSGSDDDSDEPDIVSVRDARTALRTALAFFEQQNNVVQVNALSKSLKEIEAYDGFKQTSIDSYFCKSSQ